MRREYDHPVEGRAALAAELDAVLQRLVNHGPFGSVRVVEASGDLSTDQDGDPVVRLRLVLADPPVTPGEGRATWPLDDVDALQQAAEQLIAEADADLAYVVIELYPETPEAGEEDERGNGLAQELDRDADA